MTDRPVRERRRPSESAGSQTDAPANEQASEETCARDGLGAEEAARASGAAGNFAASDPSAQFTEPAFTTPSQAEVYQAVLAEFMPMGIVEQSWCRDIARNVHHAHRLRQLRDGYLRAAATKVLHEAVRSSFTYVDVVAMGSDINQWVANGVALLKLGRSKATEAGYQQDYDNVLRRVTKIGFDPKDVDSRAYMDNMSKVEALEKLIVVTDSRRDILVRELERRRATDATALMPGAFRPGRRGYP